MPQAVRKKSAHPQHSTLTRKQLHVVKAAAIAIAVAVVMFIVYAYVHNGGIRGFLLEHQTFPGADTPSLVEGRQFVRSTLATSNAAIAGMSPIYASGLVTNEDGCKKGRHDTAISIEPGNDNFAYDCSIDAVQYYAFTQPHCDITRSLLQLDALFEGTNCDTPSSSNDRVYSKVINKYSAGSMVSIVAQDVASFKLQNKDAVLGKSLFNPCNYFPTGKVYCNSQDAPTKIADKIPSSAQTVVTVSVQQATYYRK